MIGTEEKRKEGTGKGDWNVDVSEGRIFTLGGERKASIVFLCSREGEGNVSLWESVRGRSCYEEELVPWVLTGDMPGK